MIKLSIIVMLALSVLLVACYREESDWDITVKNRRYRVTCVDNNGKEYYNKVGLDISRDGGNIAIYFEKSPSNGYLKYDVVTGNCVASQFDIRDKKE